MDNIKMDIKGISWEGVDFCEHGDELLCSRNLFNKCTIYVNYLIPVALLHVSMCIHTTCINVSLRCKPEGRGFDSRWCHWNSFRWHTPSGRTMALGLTQPRTEMGTRNISWGVKTAVHRADKLSTFVCRLYWNLEAATSWNPQGPVQGCNGIAFFLPII